MSGDIEQLSSVPEDLSNRSRLVDLSGYLFPNAPRGMREDHLEQVSLSPGRSRAFAVGADGDGNPLFSEERHEWFNSMIPADQLPRLAKGLPLKVPLHIEVHPYHYSQLMPCSNSCQHCTKGDDRAALVKHQVIGIEPERLIAFVRSFKGTGVEGVVISGNSTEPLLYPRIWEVVSAIKEADMFVKVYSNFHFGDRLLPVVRELKRKDTIRISLDAGSERAYVATHRPVIQDAFRHVLGNIERIAEERERSGSHFTIQIAFLMTRLNSSDEDLRSIVDWASAAGVNSVRFTVPLVPLIGNQGFDPKQQLMPEEVGEKQALLRALQKEYTRDRFGLEILHDDPDLPAKPFDACHHWKIIAVLGTSGRFFPCTSLSLVSMRDGLGIGNINDAGFDFWQFWNDAQKWSSIQAKLCALGAPGDCTRFEFVANQQIEDLMKKNSPPT